MYEEETKDEIDPKFAIPPLQTLGQESLKERGGGGQLARGQSTVMANLAKLHHDETRDDGEVEI